VIQSLLRFDEIETELAILDLTRLLDATGFHPRIESWGVLLPKRCGAPPTSGTSMA